MKTVFINAVLVLLGAAIIGGYQIGSLYLANMELSSDLKDLSSLTGTRIGLVVPRSVDEIRNQVIEHAAEHGIQIEPEQVNVERNGQGKNGNILFGLKLKFHFTAASPHNLDCPEESRTC